MKRRLAAAALLAMFLGGCSDASLQARYAAAANAAAFIRAARADDQATFDGYIDWPAVRTDIQTQLAAAKGGEAAVMLASAESATQAVDQMVRPANFHFKAAPGSFGGMLGAAHLALRLKREEPGRFCLREGLWRKGCVLTLAREGQAWKVVGLNLDLLRSAADNPVRSV